MGCETFDASTEPSAFVPRAFSPCNRILASSRGESEAVTQDQRNRERSVPIARSCRSREAFRDEKGTSMAAEKLSVNGATRTELCDRVKRFLALQHFPSIRRLEVSMFEDAVVLDGRIPSFHERQLAIAFCKRVAGVQKVIDRLIVSEPSVHEERGQRGQRGREAGNENEFRSAHA
jgi:BON domain